MLDENSNNTNADHHTEEKTLSDVKEKPVKVKKVTSLNKVSELLETGNKVDEKTTSKTTSKKAIPVKSEKTIKVKKVTPLKKESQNNDQAPKAKKETALEVSSKKTDPLESEKPVKIKKVTPLKKESEHTNQAPKVKKETTSKIQPEKSASVESEKPLNLNNEAAPKVITPTAVDKKKDAATTQPSKPKLTNSNDYSQLDLEQLVHEFQLLLRSDTIPAIKKQIEQIKLNFNQKFGELLKIKKEAFIADGGNEIDFQYSNTSKSLYNDLLFEYKTKRENYYSQLEKEQKENLSKRLELIEELKALIDSAEPSTMYQLFRELQGRWTKIGKIPRSKYNDVWRTYHHHVERFYDLLHLSNDFRDLDFKHNLDEKLKLVEQAEALAESTDLSKAFNELQVLHRMWKEEIGPVAREFREEIWERFSNATKNIHEKRHELQKELESKFEENVVKKREVIDQISKLVSTETTQSHKLWQQKIKELEVLRQEFFKIGKVPRAVNEKIWKEFKEVTRNFNKLKNNFYKNIKREQHENLNKKNALVEKAESLKDSTEYESTTEIMKQIQAEWRTIGHVPRKYSDKIWKQFKDACNYYFDRLHNTQDEANKEQVEVFNKKKELLERFKSQADNKEALTMEVIKSYNDDWKQLGRLPNNMRHLDVKFNKTLDLYYSKLDLSEEQIAMLKFKNNIANYLAQNNLRKLDNEQLFIRKKIDEITRESQQLENNISFISSADDNNPLLKNVKDNLENYNKQLAIWKTKLDYLTNLDY